MHAQGKRPFFLGDLFDWSGTVGPGPYALVGILGFALKHNLDRWVAESLFHRHWSFFSYWVPLENAFGILSLNESDRLFLLAMVLMAIPFTWIGLSMTVRRLRSAGLPTALLLLFFIPFVNLLFFIALALHPERDKAEKPAHDWYFGYLIPEGALGAASLSLVATALAGYLLTWLSVESLSRYGISLFLGIPFTMGFLAVVIYGYHQRRGFLQCLCISLLSPLLACALFIVFATEGLGCILMAVPIGAPFALLGGTFGYLIQRHPFAPRPRPAMMAVLLVALPLLMGMEAAAPPAPLYYETVTTMEIAAPPETVWKSIIDFPPLPEPSFWLFHTGIAYPMRAEMHGRGVGAQRHCVFSTGPFVEPVEVWDEPRRLKFSVIANPPPMEEWTPYGSIHPKHLQGFLESKGGQFLLIPLPGGKTRVEATTWYKHGLAPEAYWRIWTDWIIHSIHRRVLDHIKHLAEAANQ